MPKRNYSVREIRRGRVIKRGREGGKKKRE
jgi:hypothetical protein